MGLKLNVECTFAGFALNENSRINPSSRLWALHCLNSNKHLPNKWVRTACEMLFLTQLPQFLRLNVFLAAPHTSSSPRLSTWQPYIQQASCFRSGTGDQITLPEIFLLIWATPLCLPILYRMDSTFRPAMKALRSPPSTSSSPSQPPLSSALKWPFPTSRPPAPNVYRLKYDPPPQSQLIGF